MYEIRPFPGGFHPHTPGIGAELLNDAKTHVERDSTNAVNQLFLFIKKTTHSNKVSVKLHCFKSSNQSFTR